MMTSELFYTLIFVVAFADECTPVSRDEFGWGSLINMRENNEMLAGNENQNIGGRLLSLERHKRQLLFPVQSVYQLTLGCTAPLNLNNMAVIVNQGFQFNFNLPNLTSQLPSSFLWTPPVIDARSRDKRDTSIASSYSDSAWELALKYFDDIKTEQVYLLIENFLNEKGYNGSACLLHTICHLAAVPLHQDDDLLHDLVQFIFTPSEHASNSVAQTGDSDVTSGRRGGDYVMRNPTPIEDYLRAERLGRTMGRCDDFYGGCPNSPLDHLTEVADDDDERYSD